MINVSKKEKEKYKVVLVDDSAVIRSFTQRMLEDDPEIDVVASLYNGEVAVNFLSKHKDIDVVILDIEMPVMTGMEALPLMLKAIPNLKVIMFSTLTTQNAQISIEALNKGAVDYVTKPSTNRDLISKDQFKHELLEKVKTFGKIKRSFSAFGARGAVLPSPDDTISRLTVKSPVSVPSVYKQKEVKLRDNIIISPDVIAIGSSTGGPQALSEIFALLKGAPVNRPIFITQHMPVTFTKILAGHLAKISGLNIDEAKDGEIVRAGRIYIAPGGIHMTVQKNGADKVIRLVDAPPENFCKPAVDPMLRSISEIYGGKVIVFILTGMGMDGCKGSKIIVDRGGVIYAQNEESSVVWGMPGAVATSGLCAKILGINEIAENLKNFMK